MSSYEKALEQLQHTTTWCRGAKALAQLGNQQALIPLMRAYETPIEAEKICLLDAMEALDAKRGAAELFDLGDAEERRMAVHLMELFATDEHLSRLVQAIDDPAPEVRRQARRAMACQFQTPAWEATMIKLLDRDDAETRAQAIHSLSRRWTESARQALQQHLKHETDETLRNKINEALV